MEPILRKLFEKKRDWEYAFICCIGRANILAIEPDTQFRISDDGLLLIVDDAGAPNPIRRGPDEPATINLHAEMCIDSITSIDYVTFNKEPKIQPIKNKIIV